MRFLFIAFALTLLLIGFAGYISPSRAEQQAAIQKARVEGYEEGIKQGAKIADSKYLEGMAEGSARIRLTMEKDLIQRKAGCWVNTDGLRVFRFTKALSLPEDNGLCPGWKESNGQLAPVLVQLPTSDTIKYGVTKARISSDHPAAVVLKDE